MPTLGLSVDSLGNFRDSNDRVVVLRGINLDSAAKLPNNLPSSFLRPDQVDSFWNGDDVSFVNRPFALEDAPVHFQRLKDWGFNTIRYLYTWEALEHKGPGIYDDEFITYTIKVLTLLDSFGFYVFLDPHQDVWSRYSGGSGAPMWTLYALGLDPQAFIDTGAAIIQNLAEDPDNFPKMIWPTNYSKLACQVAFTLFFAGSDYAPNAIIDDKNIDEYLQDHMLEACCYFYRRIATETNIFNSSVFAVETMNEPNAGLIGLADITTLPESQKLRKGPTPTAFQAMMLGAGVTCEVDEYVFSTLGSKKVGTAVLNPNGRSAWLQNDSYDIKYGFKRDPGWKLGRCIWAQNGVWDDTSNKALIPDYFGHIPATGEPLKETSFVNIYWTKYWSKFYMCMRDFNKDLFLLAQPCTLGIPPVLKESPFMDRRVIYTPHYYDGLTLVKKHWSNVWNVDVVGVLRGKYATPAFAIKVGRTAIRNSLRDQLKYLKQEGLDNFGNVPCLMSETGMPFDLDDRAAYKTGDYSAQRDALDALGYALEGSQLHHALWTYCAKNAHKYGDHWNGEDFSIYCHKDWKYDDDELNNLALRHGHHHPSGIDDGSSEAGETDFGASSGDISEAHTLNLDERNSSASLSSSLSSETSQTMLMTSHKKQSNRRISTELRDWDDSHKQKWSSKNGLYQTDDRPDMKRALASIARPYPVAVKGTIHEFGYDLQSFTFKLSINADSCLNNGGMAPKAGTEVVIPAFCFPGTDFQVNQSSGTWSFNEKSRILVWWHADGSQSIEIVSTNPPTASVFGDSRGPGGKPVSWLSWATSCFGLF